MTVGGAAPRTVVQVREPDAAARRPAREERSSSRSSCKRGVLFNGSNFICLAHTDEDIDHAIEAYDAAFERLAEGLAGRPGRRMLEGEPVQPAFRPRAR